MVQKWETAEAVDFTRGRGGHRGSPDGRDYDGADAYIECSGARRHDRDGDDEEPREDHPVRASASKRFIVTRARILTVGS